MTRLCARHPVAAKVLSAGMTVFLVAKGLGR